MMRLLHYLDILGIVCIVLWTTMTVAVLGLWADCAHRQRVARRQAAQDARILATLEQQFTEPEAR